MKLIPKTRKASKFVSDDFISNMPDNVITNILDQLPIQDAVKTSSLSKYWRFKWTMLSQLVFDDDFFEYLLETNRLNNYGRIISTLLLHLKGVIKKFVLCVVDDHIYPELDFQDINNWIMFLSRNGIKDLTICNEAGLRLMLPTHIFSCLELRHLTLVHCCFDPPTSFHGFPNLLSLNLYLVEFESRKFGELFTQSPVLEIFRLGYTCFEGQLKLSEVIKLTNLKILSLFMRNLDTTCSGSIFELLGFLPKLQELHLDFGRHNSFTEDDARKRSSAIFSCLKTLKILNIDCGKAIMLSIAFEIIKSSPNLQNVEIKADDTSYYSEDAATKRSPITFPCLKTLKLLEIDLGNAVTLSFAYDIIKNSPDLQTLEITVGKWEIDDQRTIEVDYNTTRTLQLRSVVLNVSEASENEIGLIKYLLACSPFLENIIIYVPSLKSDEKLVFSTKLLKLHRASPVAEINLY